MTSTARPPFQIVPWDSDFLEALKNGVVKATRGQTGEAVVVFMHDRPRRYLTDAFRTDTDLPKPCIIPRMFTGRELFTAFRQEQDPAFRREAGRLDQIALLSKCVRELAEPGTELCVQLAKTDEAGFFPWGARLADLLEECFTQGLTPEDMLYTEGEVAPFGAALLGSLGKIFARYREALVRADLTTAGFDAFTVARRIEEEDNPPLPSFLEGRKILLAGFGMLTGTENTVFHHLWENGAQIFLHVDAALGNYRKPHWACKEQADWIAQWKADVRLACPSPNRKPKVHYFAGYDLHSQLEALREDLLELERRDVATPASAAPYQLDLLAAPVQEPTKDPAPQRDVAVALAHSGALLPVLHHLPRKDCNISLGYPLERSLLFRLLETVLDIRDRRQPDGASHWKPLTDLVRHPYLRLLEVNGISLREIFQNMEGRLRGGIRHAKPYAVARAALDDMIATSSLPPQTLAEAAPAIWNLLERLLQDTVGTWADADTLAKTADALAGLCDTLLVYGNGSDETGTGSGKSAIWTRFPIDAECLFRLMQRVIPALRDNDMAQTPLPWPLLRTMLIELVRAERVPFEADPLTGLQVLGMLETRLLRFSRVFLMDVTDDQLPGAPIRSPLLPDSLRALLGLPDSRNREQLAAYTFHRLLAGADEIWLYWQEGVESSGLFDSKKQRSRLVEELIWREEKTRGQRLRPGQEPLRTATLSVRPPVRNRKTVTKTPQILAQLALFLKQPLSATRLDAYLTCPLRFYYERLCAILPIDEVNEEDDPAEVGSLLHKVLRRFYEPAVGTSVSRIPGETPCLEEKALRALFGEELAASGLQDSLPPESAVMLSVAGPERLARFLRAQPERTKILSVEEEYHADITVCGRVRRLTGLLDRVDWREAPAENDEGAVILDYKTGRIKGIRADLWTDETFWEQLDPENVAATIADPDPEHDFLPHLARRLPTVQLLHYLYLYRQATGKPVLDAAFVALGEDGEEHPLFGTLSMEEREAALERIPDILGFILQHMEQCPEFRPREGTHCRWCSWQNVCIIPSS